MDQMLITSSHKSEQKAANPLILSALLSDLRSATAGIATVVIYLKISSVQVLQFYNLEGLDVLYKILFLLYNIISVLYSLGFDVL